MSEEVKDEVQNAELDYTQVGRRRIVDEVLTKAIDTKDPEMLNIAMKAMDGIDKNALGRKKLAQKQQDGKTNADNVQVLAMALIHASDRRASQGRPEIQSSNVIGTKLPEGRRPKYDPTMRDATPGNENTNDFKKRLEGG